MVDRTNFKIPKWIKRLPKDIRKTVEQEYLVNPREASRFAAAGSIDGIRQLRRQRWNAEKSYNSTLNAEGGLNISEQFLPFLKG